MGESVCLMRSFSQPAEVSSRETNEAVPHSVLTESVSFGRFASESLQWEKWSAFTQNRYLEEVERFTKPGSVAEKRAFFEALFKNRTAVKVTKKKIKEVNVKTSDETVCEEVLKDNLVNSEVPLVVNDAEVDSVAPSISVIDETSDVQSGKVQITTHVENFNSMAVPEGGALDEDNSTSLSKEKSSGSFGSKTCSRSSKLEPSFVIRLNRSLKKTRKEPHLSSKRSISVLQNHETSGNTDKNIVKIPQYGSRSSTNAKGVGKADKKKRSGPSSVHMPPKFASSARQNTKTAPKNSTIQETTSTNSRKKPTEASKSRKRPLPRIAKEGSDAAKCSTSASDVKLPELPPTNNQQSVNKRKNITIESSVSCRVPNNVQRQPSAGCKNLSTHSRVRAKSFTVSSPFNFRSDERAEKRKEFFKKVEEKNKKEDSVQKKLSCGFKANQKTHLASEEHKNPQVSMISLTSTRFNTSGKENMRKYNQTPHKVVSVKTNNTRNESMEKYKRCKIHPSSRSQTNKKTQENSSPNILQS